MEARVKKKFRELKLRGLPRGGTLRNVKNNDCGGNGVKNAANAELARKCNRFSQPTFERRKSLQKPTWLNGVSSNDRSSVGGSSFASLDSNSEEDGFVDGSGFSNTTYNSSLGSAASQGSNAAIGNKAGPLLSAPNQTSQFRDHAVVIDVSPAAISKVRRRREHALAARPSDLLVLSNQHTKAQSDNTYPGCGYNVSMDSAATDEGTSGSGDRRVYSSSFGSPNSMSKESLLSSPRGRVDESRRHRPSFVEQMGMSQEAFAIQLKTERLARQEREMAIANFRMIKTLRERQSARQRMLNGLEAQVSEIEERITHDIKTVKAHYKLARIEKLDCCRKLCRDIERFCDDLEPIRIELAELIPDVVQDSVEQVMGRLVQEATHTQQNVEVLFTHAKEKHSVYNDQRLPEWLRKLLNRSESGNRREKQRRNQLRMRSNSKRLSLGSLESEEDEESDLEDDATPTATFEFGSSSGKHKRRRNSILQIALTRITVVQTLRLLKLLFKLAVFGFLLSFVVVTFFV